jgi:hypothetical protein
VSYKPGEKKVDWESTAKVVLVIGGITLLIVAAATTTSPILISASFGAFYGALDGATSTRMAGGDPWDGTISGGVNGAVTAILTECGVPPYYANIAGASLGVGIQSALSGEEINFGESLVSIVTQAELGWRTSTLQSFAMKDVTNKSEQVVGNGIISGMNEMSMLTANATNNIIYRTIYGEPICIPKNSGIRGVITESDKNMGEKMFSKKISVDRKSKMDPKLVTTKKRAW